jgi:Concanavalin A-like lectin/glucanases superfamily/Putative Ig domain
MIRKKLLFPTLIWALGLLSWGILPTAAVPQAQADYFITPDAYWQFSETGAPYADSVALPANPNDAVNAAPSGTAPFTTDPIKDPSGRVGEGVAFGGTSGLQVLHNAATEVWDWAANANFAVEVWMKRNPSAGGLNTNNKTEVLVGRNDEGTSSIHWFIGLRYNTATGVRAVAQLQDAHNDGASVTLNGTNASGTNVVDNAWHQVVLVRDAVANKDLLYVDGQLEDSADATYTGGFATAVASLDIGWLGIASSTQTNFAFKGSVDQVALYGQALTAAEVNQIYQIGQSGRALDQTFAPIYPAGTTDLGLSAVGYQVTANAEAAANPMPTYALDAGAPAGMVVDPSGQLTWSPSSDQTGIVDFSVTATNSEGSGTANYTIEVVDPCATDQDAYWHLEENGSGASAGDDVYTSSVGTGLTGQCATGGCPVQDTATGQVNNAQIFDGTTGIDVPAVATADQVFDFSAVDSFTIELWMKRDASGLPNNNNTEVMIGRWDATAGLQWWIGVRRIGTGGPLRIAAKLIALGGENDVLIANAATGTNVTDGNWHHVALVRDMVTFETRLYVDGALEATNPHNYSANFNTADVPLNIGHLGSSFGYTGSLDEVAIYAGALGERVILQHATQNPGRGYCNSNPAITTAAVTTADPTLDYTYDADATDAEGDSVTWTLTTFPAGMTIDRSTGVVTWPKGDVAAAANSSVDVEIRATDTYGGAATQAYSIAVGASSTTPGTPGTPAAASSGGGGGGGGCFIESSRATGSIGTLKGFGILLFSSMAFISAAMLGGRK